MRGLADGERPEHQARWEIDLSPGGRMVPASGPDARAVSGAAVLSPDMSDLCSACCPPPRRPRRPPEPCPAPPARRPLSARRPDSIAGQAGHHSQRTAQEMLLTVPGGRIMGGPLNARDEASTVTKAELGTKRLCPNCGARYYDLTTTRSCARVAAPSSRWRCGPRAPASRQQGAQGGGRGRGRGDRRRPNWCRWRRPTRRPRRAAPSRFPATDDEEVEGDEEDDTFLADEEEDDEEDVGDIIGDVDEEER